MTVAELKARKKELGYTNEMVAERSGVPLSTVQKVFGGTTANPRRETIIALQSVLFSEPDASETGAMKQDAPDQKKTEQEQGRYYTVSRPPDDFQVRDANLAYLVGDEDGTSLSKNPGEYTVDDYYRIPDDIRAELIDGKIYLKAAPTTRHQYIATAVVTQLMNWQMAHGKSCLALVSPVDVQLDEDNRTMIQPDLVVICDRDKLRGGIIYGAPDLVMEVISPSSGGKDRILKFNKYWCAGVKEYWIIDPLEENVIVYNFASGQPPVTCSFEDRIPVGLTGGELCIDFHIIADFGRRFFEE